MVLIYCNYNLCSEVKFLPILCHSYTVTVTLKVYLLFCQFFVMNFIANSRVCASVYKQLIWTETT